MHELNDVGMQTEVYLLDLFISVNLKPGDQIGQFLTDWATFGITL